MNGMGEAYSLFVSIIIIFLLFLALFGEIRRLDELNRRFMLSTFLTAKALSCSNSNRCEDNEKGMNAVLPCVEMNKTMRWSRVIVGE